MSINELNTKAQELRELLSQIDELTAEAEAIKDCFKTEMADRGTEEMSGNGWKATWKAVTSMRFDSKTFKTAHPDLFAQFSKEQTVCRFVLA
jgi:Phage-related protein, predicted endonuclease